MGNKNTRSKRQVTIEATGKLLTLAIDQSLHEQDTDQAAALIDSYLIGQDFNEMRDHRMLKNWLEQLPATTISHYPLLCLHQAQVMAVSTAPDPLPTDILEQIDLLLQRTDTHWRAENDLARLGEVYAFRAYLMMRQGLQEESIAYASQALQWLPLTAQHWRGVCLNLLGSRALACKQLVQATTHLQEALTIWTNLQHPHGARSCLLLLATVYREQGMLEQAITCYQRVIEEARTIGDREDLIPALLGLSQATHTLSDMETAEQSAQEAWDTSERWQHHELLQRSTAMLLQIWSAQQPRSTIQSRLALLQTRLSSHTELFATIQPLLQAAGMDQASQHAQAYMEPLSYQEQRVLRLLVAERSYAEIASDLIISINTVKTHVSTIYRKLNVHNRRDAREIARHCHLLKST